MKTFNRKNYKNYALVIILLTKASQVFFKGVRVVYKKKYLPDTLETFKDLRKVFFSKDFIGNFHKVWKFFNWFKTFGWSKNCILCIFWKSSWPKNLFKIKLFFENVFKQSFPECLRTFQKT